ncbi:uncharacterized protein LOC109057288 isoform X2 [Cyprinus carpio]|uniref:Uncharacterized protein LOC109057288 isoform X2 n=1 Tax=Cyprinus carpio TaxID=7962 RepID=A0A9Q9V260_CYPCA|nr:uncharacterized protein LOC109057288 isoform X2 [Cyprinus carpio]
MASVKKLLVDSLKGLEEAELKHFHWQLNIYDNRISKSELEKADRLDTVDKMVKCFEPEKAVKVMVHILRSMNQNELAEELQKKAQEEHSMKTSVAVGEVEKGQQMTCQPAVNNNKKPSRKYNRKKSMEIDQSNRKASNVAHDIKDNWSRKIEGGSNKDLPIFKLQLDETSQNSEGFCRRSTFGKNIVNKYKTIMMIGATGAGKTTLINNMINYILGVQWEDDFRFVLIDEGKQTSEITAYQINHMDGFQVPYSLTIVDTPGFGDTRGISHDQKITKQIQEFFSHPGGIDHIDAVCFVVHASLACLTPTQKYIFDSFLSIFGNDIAENILMMVTFADGKKPPVLEAIKVSEVPCSKDQSGDPLHFKFNNSAVFASNNKSAEDEKTGYENFEQVFWKLGFSSMKKFFTSLNKMETKSLFLTRKVLEERQKLEVLVKKLQPQINEIEKTRAALEQQKEHGQVMDVQDIVASLIEQSQKLLEQLQESALKPDPLSTPDYIDLMIESEKQECKPGFQDRIQSLQEARKKAEIISKVSTGEVLQEVLEEYTTETRKNQAAYDPRLLFNQLKNYVGEKATMVGKIYNAFV